MVLIVLLVLAILGILCERLFMVTRKMMEKIGTLSNRLRHGGAKSVLNVQQFDIDYLRTGQHHQRCHLQHASPVNQATVHTKQPHALAKDVTDYDAEPDITKQLHAYALTRDVTDYDAEPDITRISLPNGVHDRAWLSLCLGAEPMLNNHDTASMPSTLAVSPASNEPIKDNAGCS